jgi:hypothetical protein
MKKLILCLTTFAAAGSSLFAAPASQSGQTMQSQQGQAADCSQMSVDEQNFAAQLTDMNNKMMFCSQFTAQQRQMAMQMMGQTDAAGNMITADQAVMQVMGMGASTTQTRSGGGCPVKQ